MNQINKKNKKLDQYKAVVFDLDGTLYYQKPFRRRMVRFLACHLFTHPRAIRDMLIILDYRKIREDWEHYEKVQCFEETMDLEARQYHFVAKRKKTTPEYVKNVISFYMLETPLKLLYEYRDSELIQMIEDLRKKQVRIVIYSDYPVENKRKVLQVEADLCFTSTDKEINSMKPDSKGLQVILQQLQMKPEEVIMVGDRYEKDGLAAVANQMDYIILDSNKKKRQIQEKELL